jgi:cytochrome c-type biogenesis protein CcmH
MVIQLLLTGVAGLALGAAIMRVIQTRSSSAPDTPSLSGAEPESGKNNAAINPRLPLSQTQMILGAAGALAVLAIAVLFFRPGDRSIAASGTAATAQSGDPSATKLDDVDTMITRLEARLQKNPADGEGFRMLGWSFQNTGKPAEAVLAYANAAKLLPKRADVQAGYGEALVAVAGDKVTPEAKSHFDEALRLDPKEPRARFFASLYKAQNGNERAALDEWIALSNSTAPDQPWQADVHQRVEKLAAKLGVDVSGRLKPLSAVQSPISNSAGGPNAAQVAAASALPAAQQQSMIDGMVNGLATKLQANPNDVDGWLKLIRSRVVLKDNARAKDDLAMARKTFGAQPAKLDQINALARELGL